MEFKLVRAEPPSSMPTLLILLESEGSPPARP